MESTSLKFSSPAQHEFTCLDEQANYFLDNYLTNWNNYDNPTGYIIPPVFNYKNCEVSDDAFDQFQKAQLEKKSKNPSEVITDRISDEAEYMVFDALQQLIQDKIKAPFISVRGLDLKLNFVENKILQGSLTKIFPELPWNKFLSIMKEAFLKDTPNIEYDFIIIGPKIGIVVIEVKSSFFTQSKHFKNGSKSLPDDYKHALQQLKSSDALIFLLQECTHISIPPKIVQKILFTSNLQKSRYDEWIDTLKEIDKDYIKNKVGDVIQWFQEDTANSEMAMDKPYLYCAFQNIFKQDASAADTLTKIYEAYAPIIAAIASIAVLPSKDRIELNKWNFSEFDTVLVESLRLTTQNPLEGKNPAAKLAPGALLERASKEIKRSAEIIFLSPDQQKALNGPMKQFILGAAGTGKTIILQAKAIKLLQKGERVVVLARGNYMWRYKFLFDSYTFKNYKIGDWSIYAKYIAYQLNIVDCPVKSDLDRLVNTYLNKVYENRDEIYQLAEEIKKEGEDSWEIDRNWLSSPDHIIIDDAFDDVDEENPFDLDKCHLSLARLMSLSNRFVWVGIDPHVFTEHAVDHFAMLHNQFVTNLLENLNNSNNNSVYGVISLRQMMRCSGKIFQAAYDRTINWRPQIQPLLGHKIQGTPITKINENYSTYDEAKKALWNKIDNIIEMLVKQNIDFNNVAIVVGTHSRSAHGPVCTYLHKQCEKYWPDIIDALPYHENHIHLLPDTQISVGKHFITVSSSNGVSSAEWPIVIYALCSSNLEPETGYMIYQKYRAMSRGTAKVFEVAVTYNEPAPSSEDEHSSDESIEEESVEPSIKKKKLYNK